MKERSLVTFTLLSQLAAGLFITLVGCFYWFTSAKGTDQALRWCTPGFILAALAMVAATITSFFHLGNLRNSWRAANHFCSSWLSREIVLVLLFTGITLLSAALAILKITATTFLGVVGGLGLIVSLSLVYTMSRIYTQRTLPTWNTWHTVLNFFLTSLLLGAVAASLLLGLSSNIPQDISFPLGKVLHAWTIFLLLTQIIVLLTWLNASKKVGAYKNSVKLIAGKHRQLLIAFILLASLAVLVSCALVLESDPVSRFVPLFLLGLNAFLVCAAEVCNREIFYLARLRQGV